MRRQHPPVGCRRPRRLPRSAERRNTNESTAAAFADPPFAQLAKYAASYGDDYNQFLLDIEEAKSQLAYIPPFEEDAEGGAVDSPYLSELGLAVVK